MAIAFDASSSGSAGNATSCSSSHTCTGSNLLLIVFAGIVGGNPLTGCTYNGVSMTEYTSGTWNISGEFASNYKIYYLYAPSTGTNTITLSCGGTNAIGFIAVSYTGVKQSAFPDAFNGFTTGANTSHSVTTSADNSWAIAMVTSANTVSAGTGSTSRIADSNVQFGGSRGMVMDSNGPKTPAGSYSLGFSTGASQNGSVAISIAPYVAPPTDGNFLMFM